MFRLLALAAVGALVTAPGPRTVLADTPKKEANTNVVLRGATVFDGTGAPGVKADVHLKGDRVAAVGAVGKIEGATELDAAGLYVCPGFIDLHTHCDTGSPALTDKAGRPNENYVTQGVTTVVTGNCGSGPVDVARFFADLEKGGVGTNVVHQAPHNSIRQAVMGNENRVPTADELRRMEELVERALDAGAVGLATGLIYNPGTYARTEEIIALARVVGRRGGLYASHIRNEGNGLLDSLEESVRIGLEGGCRVHISHIKASGTSAWGKSAAAVALIETARRKGLAITADQYPNLASSTSLRATVAPIRNREGTNKDFLARLDDPKVGPQIKKDIAAALEGRAGGGRIQIARYAPKPQWQGKKIDAIADAEKKEPIDIVMEIERGGGAQIVNFGMSEEDVRVYMRQPWVATASDGSTHRPGNSVPHPRSYGTFPRKIGRYAIEEKLVPVELAVRSATGLPADILKLTDRGYLKSGAFADVVVFDPATYRDMATFDRPHQYATGVKWVFVNGRPVIADGRFDPAVLNGRVIRFGGKQ